MLGPIDALSVFSTGLSVVSTIYSVIRTETSISNRELAEKLDNISQQIDDLSIQLELGIDAVREDIAVSFFQDEIVSLRSDLAGLDFGNRIDGYLVDLAEFRDENGQLAKPSQDLRNTAENIENDSTQAFDTVLARATTLTEPAPVTGELPPPSAVLAAITGVQVAMAKRAEVVATLRPDELGENSVRNQLEAAATFFEGGTQDGTSYVGAVEAFRSSLETTTETTDFFERIYDPEDTGNDDNPTVDVILGYRFVTETEVAVLENAYKYIPELDIENFFDVLDEAIIIDLDLKNPPNDREPGAPGDFSSTYAATEAVTDGVDPVLLTPVAETGQIWIPNDFFPADAFRDAKYGRPAGTDGTWMIDLIPDEGWNSPRDVDNQHLAEVINAAEARLFENQIMEAASLGEGGTQVDAFVEELRLLTQGKQELGTSGGETITGTDFPDYLSGLGGDDTILSNGDDDTLKGGSGVDLLDDEFVYTPPFPPDFDRLVGDSWLDGGSGNDELYGRLGDDRLLGGPGNDHLDGGGQSDLLVGGAGDDTIIGGPLPNDPSLGSDSLLNIDRALFSGSVDDYEIDFIGGGRLSVVGPDGADEVETVERLIFDDGEVRAVYGESFVVGADTGDLHVGTDFSEAVFGERGDDTFYGGQGDDYFNGGDGTNMAVFSGPRAGYTIIETSNGYDVTDNDPEDGDDGTDELENVEVLRFSDVIFDPTNEPPERNSTNAGTLTILEDMSASIGVGSLLSLWQDADGDILSVTGAPTATNGSVSFDAEVGTVAFTPHARRQRGAAGVG